MTLPVQYGVKGSSNLGIDAIESLIVQSPSVPLQVTYFGNGRGKGITATSKFTEGSFIVDEAPLIAIQNNIREIVTCAQCFTVVGDIPKQVDVASGKLSVAEIANAKATWTLPNLNESMIEGEVELTPSVVACELECGNVYCSADCRDIDQSLNGHGLLCVGQIKSVDHPLYQYKVHAISTQEEFLLAGKALAKIVSALLASDNDTDQSSLIDALLKPYDHFQSGVWWALAGGNEIATILESQAKESFSLLRDAWKDLDYLTSNADSVLTMDTYARFLSIFHLNNVGVRKISPISSYMKALAESGDTAIQDKVFDILMPHVDPLLEGGECDDSDCSDGECNSENEDGESDGESVNKLSESESCSKGDEIADDGESGEEEEITSAMALSDWGDANIDEGSSLFPMFDGCGLFPLISAINHSCQPNCKVTYGNTGRGPLRLTLQSLTDISVGDELTISYIDTALPTEDRLEALSKYGFVCDCPKCK
eukprot:CFRG2216T1